MAETIVVPTDGSETGERATAHAIALASTSRRPPHAVFVVGSDGADHPTTVRN